MRKLVQYGHQERQLRAHTLLVSMQILHFDTIATYSDLLLTLADFLQDALLSPTMEEMSIRRFVELTDLFLRNNRFYYDGVIYRFARGGPTHMSIIETLSNIFVDPWQKILVHELSLQDEFFGR